MNILMTGAGSGLGRGLVECLAREGHVLFATDRNLEAAEETARNVRENGGNAQAFRLDVTSELEIQQLMAQLSGQRIDVLVNNAGLQHVARVEEFEIAKWDLLSDVLLKGSFLMTRAILPEMRKQNFGRIIHIGSIHSIIASPFKSAYVAMKHALVGFSKVIALETADWDITSNTICPAYLRTPLVDAQIANQALTRQISEEEVIEKIMLSPMPKKSFITVEEVAATVQFLIAPHARNITGQLITIDGGWTAQ